MQYSGIWGLDIQLNVDMRNVLILERCIKGFENLDFAKMTNGL